MILNNKIIIKDINSNGDGVCIINNKVCFVPLAIPNDQIEIQQLENHKNFDIALQWELLKPSPYRINPPCPYFNQCGGCTLQHIKYSKQLELKYNRVIKEIEKNTHLKNIESITEKTVASPTPFHYRNRAQFHINTTKKEIGFISKKSSKIISIQECILLEKEISNSPQILIKKLENFKSNIILVEKKINKEIIFKDGRSKGHTTQFNQVNQSVNNLLLARIQKETKKLNKKLNILDLYCGNGNLSLSLTKYASSITGVDYATRNIKQAQEKSQRLPLSTHFFQSDCSKFIRTLLKNNANCNFDLLLVDPPRMGLKGFNTELAKLKIVNIFYISCNPSTLARDLKEFIKNQYRIEKIIPFDMFPQTTHIETLVILKKK